MNSEQFKLKVRIVLRIGWIDCFLVVDMLEGKMLLYYLRKLTWSAFMFVMATALWSVYKAVMY